MNEEQTNREKRRRRRIRSQILAYLVLVVVLVLAVMICYFGVKGVIRYVNGYNEKVNKVLEEAESSVAESLSESDNDNSGHDDDSESGNGYTSAETEEALDELIESLL
jgi:beta-N-acetylhexosaminidase